MAAPSHSLYHPCLAAGPADRAHPDQPTAPRLPLYPAPEKS
ncbi:hypothetical protein ACFYSF_05430 [Streptomyces canus]